MIDAIFYFPNYKAFVGDLVGTVTVVSRLIYFMIFYYVKEVDGKKKLARNKYTSENS